MTIDEIIETLDLAKTEVEWSYSLHYYVAIDEAIQILKEVKRKEDDLK